MTNYNTPTNIDFLLDRSRSIRASKINDYYKNPVVCKYCGEIIKVKANQGVSEVKAKKFCNKRCAASYNNKKYKKRYNKRSKLHWAIIDMNVIGGPVGRRTKKQILRDYKGYTAGRNAIRKHAQIRYHNSDKPKHCFICGYDKHIEVCHIKSVSEFSDDAFVNDINNLNNLVALCPTHHWELDNKYLNL